jgi:hypothetical protein
MGTSRPRRVNENWSLGVSRRRPLSVLARGQEAWRKWLNRRHNATDVLNPVGFYRFTVA